MPYVLYIAPLNMANSVVFGNVIVCYDISDRHKWLCFRFLSSFYLFSPANFHNEFSIALHRLPPMIYSASHFEGCHVLYVLMSRNYRGKKKEKTYSRTSNGKCITDV